MVRARAWPGFKPALMCLKGSKGVLGGCGYHIVGAEAVRVAQAGQKGAE